jgi:hypothetical protein
VILVCSRALSSPCVCAEMRSSPCI